MRRNFLQFCLLLTFLFVAVVTEAADWQWPEALLKIPMQNKDSAEQHILFPKIPDQKAGTKSVKLAATSDANVKVYHYVRADLVEINGNELRFTKIPPRTKFPLKLTVIARQYGRSVERILKSVLSVEREFS